MRIRTWTLLCASALSAWSAAQATETATYTYDALGRLTQVQVAGGPAAGVQRGYQFDPAGNRTQVVVTGAAVSAEVSMNSLGSVAIVAAGGGVAIGVNVTAAGSAGGMVTFTENGVYLGSAAIVSGQASVFLVGFAKGTHTITATYAGDESHEPQVQTFTVDVRDLSWLPAVLDIILN